MLYRATALLSKALACLRAQYNKIHQSTPKEEPGPPASRFASLVTLWDTPLIPILIFTIRDPYVSNIHSSNLVPPLHLCLGTRGAVGHCDLFRNPGYPHSLCLSSEVSDNLWYRVAESPMPKRCGRAAGTLL
ncbi:hypothetical protein QBC36DRAFT_85957 [Triangularia setosa]|uniref:Uncharacterized protein n=1 Tax=Triangularia setosa TaxID=2587417 RepID=A0AAN7A8D0_9PEZI|nr:hypothetical protein QBC36DRAFT_85957 [Podospora setosa]